MKKVFVGLSGGVDSSLSAALLKEQGYNVTGVFMKNWTRDIAGWPCPWRDDFRDAERVAIQLGIELRVFDFQKEYKQKVVDYMIDEYKAGRTPNPDIMCNQEIKFKLFLDTALDGGADFIATGHYARIRKVESGEGLVNRSKKKSLATNHYSLITARDAQKDQTYFLYRVTEKALGKTLFPIGEFASKEAVRAEAGKRGLATAEKPDSQGICFVGEVGIEDFIREFVELNPGPIVAQDGKEIGQHDGAALYTVGQRHGLNVGGGTPYYVTKVDTKKNSVYVTNQLDDEDLWKSELRLGDTHWINEPPKANKIYKIRTRHRGELLPGKVKVKGKQATVILVDPVRAVAPGQSAVIYENETVIGGGVIL